MAEDLNRDRLAILGEIGRLTQQINRYNAEGITNAQRENELNRERIRLGRQLQQINEEIRKSQRTAHAEAQADAKSMSSMYDKLKKSELQRIDMMRNAGNLSDLAVTRGNNLAEINRKISALTAEQSLEREILQDQFDEELRLLSGQQGISDEIITNLREQNKLATDYASLSEGVKEQLQAQLDVYDGIKKSIGGVLDTFSILTSGPAGFLGTTLIGAGFAADKLGASMRKFGGYTDSAQLSALGLSFAFDDAEETAMSLSQQFGGLKDVSFATQLNTNLMATNMGITGDEAATVIGSFAKLNNMSAETATDMAATTKSMAKAAGVPISRVMKDVAKNTEAFALYGKNGGKNIAQAAVAAAKLGVELDAMTRITDSLLDFETSINNELELGAMLGKNLNLDRARALAFEEDMPGAVQETIKQLGGIDAFNKMDIFQKRKAAELLGIQVSEFQSIAANADKLNETSDGIESTWSTVTEMFTAFATGPMGSALKSMGGMVIAAGQMTPFLKDMGINLGGMVKSTFQVLKNMVGMVFQGARFVAMKIFDPGMLTAFGDKLKGIGSTLADSKLGKGIGSLKDKLMAGVGGVKPPVPGAGAVPAPSPAGGVDKASAFGKINASALLKGAAAIAIMAGALWIFAKATQEFGDKVNWPNVFIGIGAMALLGGVAALLGLAGPMILIGAGAMLLAAGAFYVFGLASQEVAKGLTMLGPAFVSFAAGMTAFVDAPYIRFGFGLAALAYSLVAFGAAFPFIMLAALGMTALAGGLTLLNTALPNFVTAAGQMSGIDLTPFMSLAAMAPLFFMMALAAPGVVVLGAAFMLLSSAMSALVTSLPSVMEQLSQLAQLDFLPILGLAGALTTLSIALAAVAATGMLALPALLALGLMAGATAAVVGGGGGSENEKMDELIGEIKGLRADLVAGKIGVNMDGVKVTSRISGIVDKIGSNSYAKV